MRGKIIMLYKKGYKEPYIYLCLKLFYSAVKYTIKNNKQRSNNKTLLKARAQKCFI
jgi:hypothetical protein